MKKSWFKGIWYIGKMDMWDLILIKNCIVLKTLTYLHSDLLLCTGKYSPPFYFRPLSVGKFKTGLDLLFIILEHNKFMSGQIKDSTNHFACVKGPENNYAYSGKL